MNHTCLADIGPSLGLYIYIYNIHVTCGIENNLDQLQSILVTTSTLQIQVYYLTKTQTICITFVQRRPSVFVVLLMYANVTKLLCFVKLKSDYINR